MITHFADRRLRELHFQGDGRRLPPALVAKLERILDDLDEASEPAQMARPSYRLHQLRGDLAGFWSVRVSGNWRMIFRFDGGNIRDVRLIDYH